MLFRPGLVGRVPCPGDWYYPSAAPTIDNAFTSGSLGNWTLTRSSANATNCLYTDSNNAGNFTVYAANAPRWFPQGLLIEPTATNLFLNSEAPVTQTITVVNGNRYVVWMLGTGSIALSNAATGTVTAGVPVSFMANSTSLTLTCTAPITRVQVEAGLQPTSYIQTTGTTATRSGERLVQNFFGGQLNAEQGTYWVEFMSTVPNFPDLLQAQIPGRLMVAGTGSFSSNNNTDQLQVVNNGSTGYVRGNVYDNAGGNGGTLSTQVPMQPQGGVSRVALSVSQTRMSIAIDYTLGGAVTVTYRPTTLLALTLGCGGGDGPGGNDSPFNGYIRGFKYWPFAMTDNELKECTGAGYYKNAPVFDLDGTVLSHWRQWSISLSNAPSGIATDALMTDPPGTAYTQYPAANTTIRTGPRGILLDFNRFNYIANSYAPAASGTTSALGVGIYYIASMRGTGSWTLSNGTGVSPNLPATITQGMALIISVTTSGTLTWTSTGQLELAMIENIGGVGPSLGFNANATAFIRTTAGGQTRGAQGLSLPVGSWGQGSNYTVFFEFIPFSYTNSGIITDVGDGTNTNTERFYNTYVNSKIAVAQVNTVNGVGQGGLVPDTVPALNMIHRVAYSQQTGNKRQMSIDGVLTSAPTAAAVSRALSISVMKLGISNNVFFPWNSFLRRLRYYDYGITDDDLVALTSGTTLDLDFTTNVLDSRITFTRASTGTYFDSTGTMQSAATNVARFDYDAVTHALQGMLVEEARTNRVLNGNSPAPTGGGATIASSTDLPAVFAPATIYKHTITSAASRGSVSVTGLTASTQYIFSFWAYVPSSNTTTAANVLYNNAGEGGTGVQGPSVTPAYNMSAKGTWQLLWRSYTTGASETSASFLIRGLLTGDIFYTTLYQCEAGAFPTSYIPTTGSAATRAVDVPLVSGIMDWYNPAAGAFLGEFSTKSLPVGTQGGILRLDNGTNSNFTTIFAASVTGIGQIYAMVGGVEQVNNNVNSIVTDGLVHRYAMTYGANTAWHGVGDGQLIPGPGTSVVPLPITRLLIGGSSANTANWKLNGYVRRIRYWPRVLSDAEMVSVTT